MAFHDLTISGDTRANFRSLLGNCLKFIPTPTRNVRWAEYETKILPRFIKELWVKVFMAGKEENATAEPYNPRMYVPTGWQPKPWMNPALLKPRVAAFWDELKKVVKPRRGKHNLQPHQRNALRKLRKNSELLVVQCDKNLGPALIERERYIKMIIRDHLNDKDTYCQLSALQAKLCIGSVRKQIESWMTRHADCLTKNEKRFLRKGLATSTDDPYGVFYGTMKVHKKPLKTRPVVSYSGSIAYALGVWIDSQLQSVAKQQLSYFKDSVVLKGMLDKLKLPANARLFTADAVSMYTNIPTDKGLHILSKYLNNYYADNIHVDAVMSALKIVMKNNIFRFGDLFFRQRTGTAMGAPPAPPWATLYMAVAENEFVQTYSKNLIFYKRFIDDVIGIWIDDGNSDTWDAFVSDLNDEYFELEWEVSKLSIQVDYMDLTLGIREGRITTTLYEKANNLHLYIPPKSCHPPGLLPGMVHGMVYRICKLCGNKDDRKKRIQDFYAHLRRRGYERRAILPLFNTAIERQHRAPAIEPPEDEENENEANPIHFHIQWHPKNPSPSVLQRIWRETISEPARGPPLARVKNHSGKETRMRRMIISHSRPQNLGNLLSYRNLHDDNGPPVSSYMD